MIKFEVLTQPGCQPCEAIKAKLAKMEGMPAVEYIDVSTPEGRAIAVARGVRQVPKLYMDNIELSQDSFFEHLKHAA